MTTAEAARELGVTPRRVRAMIASGRLRGPGVEKSGRDWSVSMESLAAVRDRRPGNPGWRTDRRDSR
jgi:excisionase family DNA binding protein